MGALRGNNNASKGAEWRQAVVRAIKTYEDQDVKRGQALLRIARRLAKKALDGEMPAIEEIANP